MTGGAFACFFVLELLGAISLVQPVQIYLHAQDRIQFPRFFAAMEAPHRMGEFCVGVLTALHIGTLLVYVNLCLS